MVIGGIVRAGVDIKGDRRMQLNCMHWVAASRGIGTSMQNQWTYLMGFAVDEVQSSIRTIFFIVLLSLFINLIKFEGLLKTPFE